MPAQHPVTQPAARRRLVAALTTLAAWTVAFAVVLVLLTAFGRQLTSLPPALRALVISGVLVAVMVNVVMPRLSKTIPRLLAVPPDRMAGGLPQTEQAPQMDDDQTDSTPVDTLGRPAEPDDKQRPQSGLASAWAAYPVHPPLTHVTIGAYTTATILAVAAASGVSEPTTTKGWWLALVVGFAASILTSASGLADFLTLGRHHPARPAVVRHLLPALSTFPCFGAAIVLGHPSYLEADIAPVPLTLTAAGFIGLTAAGSAGGRLVFTRGLRVKSR